MIILLFHLSQNVKAKCIHRVSKAGFEQMMKKTCQNRGITRDKASLQCPVTGCRGLWTDADTVLDEEMVARMEMHGRSQANLTQQQLHSSQEDAIDLDD